MKELIVAKSAGFCFGVSRSVQMAEEMLASDPRCFSLGQLIHNDDVVRHLEDEGLTVVDSPEGLTAGDAVIVRSHGIGRAEYEAPPEPRCMTLRARRSSASMSWLRQRRPPDGSR